MTIGPTISGADKNGRRPIIWLSRETPKLRPANTSQKGGCPGKKKALNTEAQNAIKKAWCHLMMRGNARKKNNIPKRKNVSRSGDAAKIPNINANGMAKT